MLVLQTIFDDIDITDMKIYYDTEKQQYKHKFYCCDCGKPTFCMCYNSLEEAYMASDEGMECDKCSLKFNMLDIDDDFTDAVEMIVKGEDSNRTEKLAEFVISLLTQKEIDELMSETYANCGGEDISGAVCK